MADGSIEHRQVPAHEEAAGGPVVPELLMIWLSPSFPAGSFAFSHGLEKLVEDGNVSGRASLETWLGDVLTLGGLRNDLILISETWRAAEAGSRERVAEISALALALQPSAERYLETLTQGQSFHAAIAAAWPGAAFDLHPRPEIAYPIAVGLAASGHGLALEPTLRAYALAFTQNLVSAAIRLGVIGQTDGQRVIAALLAACRQVAREASCQGLEHLGSATLASDLASLRHETQYSRLFRS